MRSLETLLGAAVLVVVMAAPAAAHVSVQPAEATQGSEGATFTFHVPNEEASATTTTLEIQLPADAAFEHVSTKPVADWTVARTDTTITWSGGTIGPGELQEFEISVGPLPTVDELVFKAVQTYDNGDVVRWIEPTPADGTEPEHPAPTVHLVAGPGDDQAVAATTTTVADETAAPPTTEPAADEGDDDSKVVGAYVLAIAGVALGATALVRTRRTKPPAETPETPPE